MKANFFVFCFIILLFHDVNIASKKFHDWDFLSDSLKSLIKNQLIWSKFVCSKLADFSIIVCKNKVKNLPFNY